MGHWKKDEQGLPGIYEMVKSKVWLLAFSLRVTVSSLLCLTQCIKSYILVLLEKCVFLLKFLFIPTTIIGSL